MARPWWRRIYSATTEVVGPGGLLVPVQRHFTTARMVDFALPDLDAMDAALETLYQDPAQREMLQARAIRHAQQFNWDQTAQGFWELFQAVTDAMNGNKRVTDSDSTR